jgi:hypothetical protein
MIRYLRPLLAMALGATTLSASASVFNGVAYDQMVVVPGFSYGPDRAFSGNLRLRRIDSYAADAKVYVARDHGLEEIPRSDLLLFVGDPKDEPQRMYLAVSADGTRFEGAVFEPGGTQAIAGRVVGDRLQVESSARVEDQSSGFQCGGGLEQPAASHGERLKQQLTEVAAESAAPKGGATRQAVIAIDTDNEFMNVKFGNNQTNANNYIAALIAGMNVFYERDLNVRLQLGTVILRPSTTADPYPSGTDSDIIDGLDEFSEHWRVTPSLAPGLVPRAFSALLSGKLSSLNSASGIAWIITSGNYCSSSGQVIPGVGTFGHYSLTRVFKFNGATAATDVSIVGHELGHNFGAAHTHCSSSVTGAVANNANQLIDRCFNAETISGGVCHSGATSCPTDNSVSGRGSLMSYCNFPTNIGGANCGPVLQEFHPAHQTFLGSRITFNFNAGCITPIGSNVGPLLTPVSPANNSSTNLGGGTVGAQKNGSITYSVSGGSGTGTTQLSCSVGSGTVSVVSGTPQTISVNGSVNPVGVRFTLSGVAQQGVVNCSAVRQGAATSNFSYTFTVPAGTAPSPSKVFCSGFESGQTGVCAN